MAILDLFSKRRARARGEISDVYQYEEVPVKLRVQVALIISDAFGEDGIGSNRVLQAYTHVNEALCREYGLFSLTRNPTTPKDSVMRFLTETESHERALDVIEVTFQLVDTVIRENSSFRNQTFRRIEADDAISELNTRFREAGLGYQFESGEIIRVDSQYIHSETVKPVLTLLAEKKFRGANDEFLEAHAHYRHGRNKECLVSCLKAFESTLKSICKSKKWKFSDNDTAKALINLCLTNGLLPAYSETQLALVRGLLESGVPTIRNKNAGHGQGVSPAVVSGHLARYGLHLTATTILFLIETHNSSK